MKYTIKHFRKDFPTEERCLKYIFATRFPTLKGFYPIKGRRDFVEGKTGKHISPLVNTIFENSSTPLYLWFFAIYLFSNSKNGVSAKELQRQLGVSYPTALRMGRQIRKLMKDDSSKLDGVVELDETFISKTPVLGAIERGGNVRVKAAPKSNGITIAMHVINNIKPGAQLRTDENKSYMWLDRHYERQSVNHSKEYVRGDVHINSMEGFWSQVKRSIHGTHHYVSPKHLQSYLDFFSFQHLYRTSEAPPFLILLQRACL